MTAQFSGRGSAVRRERGRKLRSPSEAPRPALAFGDDPEAVPPRQDPRHGAGRTCTPRRRNRRARPALSRRGRADDFRRRLRRLAPPLQRAGGRLPRARRRGLGQSQGRRAAVGEVRQGPPRRADALARQHLRRRGGRGFLRPRAALSRAGRGRAADDGRRAQDRRALLLAALRERRTRSGGDARRRLRGRGRHRQRAHDLGDSEPAARRAAHLRGARRGLYAPRRFRRAQRPSGGGGQADLRQSAQLRRRLAAPARPAHHRLAAARLLRLRLGRDQRAHRRRRSRARSRRCGASACRPIR